MRTPPILCMVTIRGLKPLEGTLSVQSVPLNKTLLLQGNVYLMVMAGEILISLLVDKLVSNDLITCVTIVCNFMQYDLPLIIKKQKTTLIGIISSHSSTITKLFLHFHSVLC